MSEFEWDNIKSLANKVKHGAWLADAPSLWQDPRKKYCRARIIEGEFRAALYGYHHGKIWKAFFTLRAGKIRLVSFRPAKRKERAEYFRL
ncbi:MAG: hypothetical protein A3G75_04280 [Verrucomicrobia bacterium RIFCSPLOWO2_12_FULL_64_8]|nr:MAG: hypothetical protein A3G75_04280 [Verrucomicrobia bacterium RIFCSPLOWO2_12_FULL_64_8]